ncbi:hypothetical protein D3C77_413770 [compost metagenome]
MRHKEYDDDLLGYQDYQTMNHERYGDADAPEHYCQIQLHNYYCVGCLQAYSGFD